MLYGWPASMSGPSKCIAGYLPAAYRRMMCFGSSGYSTRAGPHKGWPLASWENNYRRLADGDRRNNITLSWEGRRCAV